MDLKQKQKIVKIVGAAEEALDKLEKNVHSIQAKGKSPAKSDTQLLKSIYHALDTLQKNPFAGDPIQKQNIPKDLQELPNLFRIEISQFWRMIYYVSGDEVRIITVVFEICDHKQYDKIFGYKRK